MANNSHAQEYLKSKLADFEKKLKNAQAEYFATSDVVVKVDIENRIDLLIQQIEETKKEQIDLDEKQIREEFDELIKILKSNNIDWEKLIKTYKTTLLHWPVRVSQNVVEVETLITELNKIAQGNQPYSALMEFLSSLFHGTEDLMLSNALTQWGKQYCAGVDWLEVYEQVQESQDKQLENAQPAILIKIIRSDEASTQSQDASLYYQINAWLIEDIESYKQKNTGYHSLILPDSPDAQPLLLESLQQKISHFLKIFLEAKSQICNKCVNYPQVHVFLPMELMHLGADVWALDAESTGRKAYLGHDHVVVVRCARRYEGNYTKAPSWNKLWQKYQTLLQEQVHDVLVPGRDNDLDELMETLEQAVTQPDSKIVGLRATQAPLDPQELCYEILDAGLPIAIWQRRDLAILANGNDLPALLMGCCLEHLPTLVQLNRRETRLRKNSVDKHIGHHLTLLLDDPYLVPPKSA